MNCKITFFLQSMVTQTRTCQKSFNWRGIIKVLGLDRTSYLTQPGSLVPFGLGPRLGWGSHFYLYLPDNKCLRIQNLHITYDKLLNSMLILCNIMKFQQIFSSQLTSLLRWVFCPMHAKARRPRTKENQRRGLKPQDMIQRRHEQEVISMVFIAN